jgi:hypothetical protein
VAHAGNDLRVVLRLALIGVRVPAAAFLTHDTVNRLQPQWAARGNRRSAD